MGQAFTGNQFYKRMGVLLLGLVITGFGSAAIVRGQNPLEMPTAYHVHGISYLIWFSLFVFQASLIGIGKRQLHMTIGKISPVVILTMLITGWMMARMSFERGVSPIPDISIHQFTAFPLFDLLGLLVFYVLAIVKRSDAEFHKRAMLLGLIAIMDPATARIGLSIGFPPFPLIASLLLVGAVIWHDKKVLNRIHYLTWFGLLWIFLRLGFVFGFASSEIWVKVSTTIFN